MRIVHDVKRKMQVASSELGVYNNHFDTADNGYGFRVELMAVSPDDKEQIYIEGDAKHIIDMLESFIFCIKAHGGKLVEEGKLVKDWQKNND